MSAFLLICAMQSISAIQQAFVDKLKNIYPEEEAKAIFYILLEDLFQISKMGYLHQKDNNLGYDESRKISEALEALLEGRPVQYITGTAHFYGSTFLVDENVLIPRPETEELVSLIIKENPEADGAQLIDIGTGSGCIAISLKKHLPKCKVDALEISDKALRMAKKNASQHKTDINLICADIFEWEYIFNDKQYDIVVSNPPYVRECEKSQMHDNVLRYEPAQALFVDDSSPLVYYNTIIDFSLSHLAPSGVLYFEINQYLGQEMLKVLENKGFKNCQIHKDLNGADRMISARLS